MGVRLTDTQKEALESLAHCTGRVTPERVQLEAKGLVQTGRGRFGDWARLTPEGRQYLASSSQRGRGSAKAGASPPKGTDSAPRNGAKHAQRTSTGNSPPTVAQNKGAPLPTRRKKAT